MIGISEKLWVLARISGRSENCGWMTDPVAQFLYGLVKMYDPDVVVQTGHLWGKSALVTMEAMTDGVLLESREQKADEQYSEFCSRYWKTPFRAKKFISIDPYQTGVPNPEAAVKFLEEQYPDVFVFIKQPSKEYFAYFEALELGKINGIRKMGIVDGDHTYEGCLEDLKGMAQVGCGLILVDDTEFIPAVGEASNNWAEKNQYDCRNLPYWNGVILLTRR